MHSTLPSHANTALLEEQYSLWKDDPRSVDANWAAFFEGFELGLTQSPAPPDRIGTAARNSEPSAATVPTGDELALRTKVVSMVYAFRTIGHTAAWTDPLSDAPPAQPVLEPPALGFETSDLDRQVLTNFYQGGKAMSLRNMIASLRETYCGRIGFEFMHIHKREVRNWLRGRIEARPSLPPPPREAHISALRWILEANLFEEFLHKKYVGQKRFSLEGGEAVMVALQGLFEAAPEKGISEIVMGMAHRGRLSILANYLQKPLEVLLHEFAENYVHDAVAGDGDVKYHLGFETRRTTASGHEVGIYLAANPSHLEAVNPVVEGKARARQRILVDTANRRAVMPVLLHGDAAFAGQGAVAEVLNLSQLPGYRTGGTIHIIINNQIGFTTQPEDARSSSYCTDVAKMIEAPVIHVNGDHPMEVLFATQLALDFRQEFGRDIVIDMVCYRRHGHNEGDEPAFTQPMTSRQIQSHPPVGKLFAGALAEQGILSENDAEAIATEINDRLEREYATFKDNTTSTERRSRFSGSTAIEQVEFTYGPDLTGIDRAQLLALGEKLVTIPPDFRLNPALKKRFLGARERALETGKDFDWAHAEALAFASLLVENTPVRLSGQDVRRGTFSHRHAVLYDTEDRERHIPLKNLAADQAEFCCYNSLLSEAAVLGFDYGYSLMVPDMLICWEAQFGDFANGAQVIIDQFIASAESKWQQPSNLVMLLPHGYEGMGPEHSSARLERFLQLCAESNIQVCNLTTPAQYFHALRRQVRREFRKPLILMTPKSLLRHPQCVSTADEMAEGTFFNELIDDHQLVEDRSRVTRIIFCTGKVYYDLLEFRNVNKLRNAAIIRIEQLYPFHWKLLGEIISLYPRANKKFVWCQEEPLNMGAWSYVNPRLEMAVRARVRYAGRERSSSPAAGAKAIHVREQRKLVEDAFCV
jgi:2-oxoglutarate dehydrogenase E1 component